MTKRPGNFIFWAAGLFFIAGVLIFSPSHPVHSATGARDYPPPEVATFTPTPTPVVGQIYIYIPDVSLYDALAGDPQATPAPANRRLP